MADGHTTVATMQFVTALAQDNLSSLRDSIKTGSLSIEAIDNLEKNISILLRVAGDFIRQTDGSFEQ